MLNRIRLGDITIHRIVENVAPFVPFLSFFPDLPPETLREHQHWLAPSNFDPVSGNIILTFQSYLLETPHHLILIDSCVGNDKERPTRPMWHKLQSDRYLRNLKAAGFAPDDIDFVCCTHLHGDHVGWNTRLDNGRWVPTFPNARYLFSGQETAFWTEQARLDPSKCPWIVDSVLPIVAAGRADLVGNTHAISDLISFFPTPGHTIDHMSVRVGRPGADAVITGDMVHSPLQVLLPQLGMIADYDRKLGGETRRRVFAEIADTPTLCCTAHFPEPSIGRIISKGRAFEFVSNDA